MSRRTEKRRYGKYNKFDVVYADFGKNPHVRVALAGRLSLL